jgi:putative aldouronate transport system substrate-binding protein
MEVFMKERSVNKAVIAGIFIFVTVSYLFAGGGQSTDGGVKEASSLKLYPSGFTPSGTNAATYKEKLDYFISNFIKVMTDRGDASKIRGYDQPLTVYSSNFYSSAFQDFVNSSAKPMYGETWETNRFTDAVKRAYNIDLKWKWFASTDDYERKLLLDMAANDLPDIFPVLNQADLVQMAQAGAIQELSSTKDQYASARDREIWAIDQNLKLDMATVDGKLYATVTGVPDSDNYLALWIRKDWLERCSLNPPKTLDEFTAMLEVFAAADFDKNGQKDAYFEIDKALFRSTSSIFNAFKAYPEIWEVKNGNLAFGGLNENNKAALKYLNDLYKKGLIDKEFISYNDGAVVNVDKGKSGAVFYGWWFPQRYGETALKEPGYDWIAVAPPTPDGKLAMSTLKKPNVRAYVAVKASFPNPELAWKLSALAGYFWTDKDTWWWIFEGSSASQYFHFPWVSVSGMDNNLTYLNLMEAYNHNNDTSLLRAKGIPYWDNLHNPNPAFSWGWERMCGPGPYTAMAVFDEAKRNNTLFYDAVIGAPSQYMQERWQTILDNQLVMFIKMITGEIGIDTGFDQWVKTFSSLGGDRITQEVNDWYKKKAK